MLTSEGLLPVAISGALTVGVGLLAGWGFAVAPAALTAWLVVLFTNRRPDSPLEPLALLAPFDGRVQRVDSVEDPWLQRRATRFRVSAAFPGISIVYAPTEGTVCGFWVAATPFDSGACLAAQHPTRSPNCYAVGIRTDEGDEVLVAISSTRPVSRFRLDVSPGERVGQGRRIGFVYFAGYADVLAPRATRTAVEPGDEARAGESILGSMVRG